MKDVVIMKTIIETFYPKTICTTHQLIYPVAMHSDHSRNLYLILILGCFFLNELRDLPGDFTVYHS